MSDAEQAAQKRRQRAEMRARLAALPTSALREAGHAVADRVEGTQPWRNASVVALFASLPDEISTDALMERVLRSGRCLLLPRMRPSARSAAIGPGVPTLGGELDFHRVDGLERLVNGRFGVREPGAGTPRVPLAEDTLVFVPGLAFDRRGGRLGRGAGYYDRALSGVRGGSARPTRVGLGHSLQLVDRVPMSSHDVRLDAMVTERELVVVSDRIRGGASAGRDETGSDRSEEGR